VRKIMYIDNRTRKKLLIRINQILEINPSAELVSVVERNKLYTAFIRYDPPMNTEGIEAMLFFF